MNAKLSKNPVRKQRADRLGLLVLWAESSLETRHSFGGSFARFERYAASEAERLIRSAGNSGKTAKIWKNLEDSRRASGV
jgi:hypothetical protein